MNQNAPNGGESKTRPPYLSYKTFKNFLNSFASADQIPSHIDRTVLPSTMSGGNQVGTINALKFFKLVSETGEPLPEFYAYAGSEGDDKKHRLRDILSVGYAFLLNGLDIERATTGKVIEKFKEAGMSGDTIRKAILFFQFAAKDADMKISTHIKPYTGTRMTKASKTRGKSPAKSENEESEGVEDSTDGQTFERHPLDKTPYQVLIDILSPDMEKEEQEAVWTLIRYLKTQEILEE